MVKWQREGILSLNFLWHINLYSKGNPDNFQSTKSISYFRDKICTKCVVGQGLHFTLAFILSRSKLDLVQRYQ